MASHSLSGLHVAASTDETVVQGLEKEAGNKNDCFSVCNLSQQPERRVFNCEICISPTSNREYFQWGV